jgi:hypothetical protein
MTMKFLTVLATITAVEAAALPRVEKFDKRQAGILNISLGFFGAVASAKARSPTAPFQVIKSKSELFPHATREKFIFGPYKLQPSNVCFSFNLNIAVF